MQLKVGHEYQIRDSKGRAIANVSVIGKDAVMLNRLDGTQIKQTTIAKAQRAARELGHAFHKGHYKDDMARRSSKPRQPVTADSHDPRPRKER